MWQEIRGAGGTIAGLPAPVRDLPRAALVGGLAFYPLAGALLGGAAACAARAAAPLGPLPSALAAAAVLTLVGRGRTLRALPSAGRLIPAAMLAGKAAAIALLPAGARMLALPLACMLGRWALVVQCYGGTPPAGSGLAAQLVGRARLREFGWASGVALGTTLAVLDAIGLVVLLAATLTAVAIRVVAYRRLGGVDGRVLGASGELVELVALAVLAGLARR